MFKYTMLLVVMCMLSGCSSKSAENKGFVRGCSAMAHDILDQQGIGINDAKLAEYCEKLSEKISKNMSEEK